MSVGEVEGEGALREASWARSDASVAEEVEEEAEAEAEEVSMEELSLEMSLEASDDEELREMQGAVARLREQLAVDGKLPLSVVVVTVRSAYMHCAKAFMRSKLWQPESWPDRQAMPTLGAILHDQLALAESADDTDRWLAEAYKQTMW